MVPHQRGASSSDRSGRQPCPTIGEAGPGIRGYCTVICPMHTTPTSGFCRWGVCGTGRYASAGAADESRPCRQGLAPRSITGQSETWLANTVRERRATRPAKSDHMTRLPVHGWRTVKGVCLDRASLA